MFETRQHSDLFGSHQHLQYRKLYIAVPGSTENKIIALPVSIAGREVALYKPSIIIDLQIFP